MNHVTPMPLSAGIRLGSAALQAIADDHGVDLLHIKGAAVHESLLETAMTTDRDTGEDVVRSVPRPSVDVDVLVRPRHIGRLFKAMREHGWVMVYRFQDDSAFEHASTWLREGLSAADVHRTFPGIGADPESAFERLWSERRSQLIAGYPCPVPSVTAQRLIMILHAVRGGDLGGDDIRRAWATATRHEREAVDALASQLQAGVALAAGTGRLETHRGSREYALWRLLSTGNTSRAALWSARVRAQPTLWSAVRTAIWLVAPKPGRLRGSLGHEPSPRDVARAWLQQAARAWREFRAAIRRRPSAGRR